MVLFIHQPSVNCPAQVTVGTIIQTSAQNYAMFLVGRILTGVAVYEGHNSPRFASANICIYRGGLVGTVPIYNSEIAYVLTSVWCVGLYIHC